MASTLGRPPKKKTDEQLDIYVKYKDDLLNSDRTLKPRTAKVFEDIGNELGMTSNAVHLSISRKMVQIFGENNYESKNRIPKEKKDDDVDYCYEHATGSTITVRIPDELQNDFKIVSEVKNNRTIKKIAPGWTDSLFKIITAQLNLDCVFNFTKATLYQVENGTEFETQGDCAEANCVMSIMSSENRTQLQLKFQPGSGTHSHTKFRRVTATKANKLFQNLQSDSVNNVFLQQMHTVDDDAERLPADFVSYKSLTNIKSKHSSCNSSAMNELRKMKYSPEFGKTIKELQSDPFVNSFWTQQQLFLYAQKAAEYGYIIISIDATGSVITNSSLLTDISDSLDGSITLPHVFLYLISVKCAGKSVPVGQMLSAQQDSTRITYFFNRWLEDFKRPSEVVIDDSKAFLKSCAAAFTSCKSIKQYVKLCFQKLAGEDVQLPESFLRLDDGHYIKNLHKNAIWKQMPLTAKHFYLSCVGFTMQCESYEDICEIVEHMVKLANGVSGCKESLEKLTEIIKTHQTDILSQSDSTECFDDDSSNDEQNIDKNDDPDDDTWFDAILIRLTDNEPAEQIEPYFNPKLNKFMKHIFDRLPLWSAVMKRHFKSPNLLATSNDTESRFNVIKGPLFTKQKLPLRPDTFMKTMIPYISSLSKLENIKSKVIFKAFWLFFSRDFKFRMFFNRWKDNIATKRSNYKIRNAAVKISLNHKISSLAEKKILFAWMKARSSTSRQKKIGEDSLKHRLQISEHIDLKTPF